MPLQRIIQAAATPLNVAEARLHVRQVLTVDDAKLDASIRAVRDYAESQCNRTLVATRFRLTIDSFPGQGEMGVPAGTRYSLPGQAIVLERGPVLAVQSIKYLDMSGAQQTLAASEYTADVTGLPARITPLFGKIWPPVLPQINAVEVVYDAGDCAALSADASTDIISIRGGLWRALAVNDALRLSNSGGALPAPLAADTDYYVQSLPTATSFKLAATAGGAAIDLTDTGSGTSYIGATGDGLKAWMLLRLGSLYEHREDAMVVERAQLVSLPFIDRLLDEYRCTLN